MDKTEQIQLLDEKICWKLTNETTGESIFMSSFDDAIIEVKREKNHWLHQENEEVDVVLLSSYFSEILTFLNKIQREADQGIVDRPQAFINEQSLNHVKVSLERTNQYGRYQECINFKVLCLSSNEDTIEYIDYAYKELYLHGDDEGFNRFVKLTKRQLSLPNMLSSGNEEELRVAAQYLGLVQKKYAFPTQNQFNEMKLSDINSQIDAANERLDGLRRETEAIVDNANGKLNAELGNRTAENEAYKEEMEKWREEKNAELDRLKKTYEENLRLAAPVKFWEDAAAKKRRSFKVWLGWTAGISLILIGIVSFLFCVVYSQPEGAVGQLIPLSFIVVALIAVLIYAIKTLVKITMTERHLSTEFEEKAMFTHFYLSLLQNEGASISEQDKLLIYSSIFACVDTGLVKHQSDSGMGIGDLVKTIGSR